MLALCQKTNMVIYSGNTGDDPDREVVRKLGQQFGLHRLDHNMCADEDAITALQVGEDALHKGFIPYTTRPIAWHTDGYYNPLDRQIRAMVLHCVQPAESGGENQVLDYEIAYIQLRDANPDYIRALSQPDAMTIPANIAQGKELRPSQSGPVFSVFPDGRLHMRYTARTRSIEWRSDPITQEAVAFLVQTLNEPSPYRFRGQLQSGQGLLCNNILHTRSRFENGERQRLLYRARYYDRIAGV
jgi:alpha-ketoglutarate-dependent taurine dioxygenase